MIKVAFILDHKLMHYRLPLFNGLVKMGYEITVFHTGKQFSNSSFKDYQIQSKKFLKTEYRKLPSLNDFDIVVAMQNLRILNLWEQTLNPFKKYKLIHWGIGVSSAKGLSGQENLTSKLRNLIATYSDAIILYSDFPKNLFSAKNYKKLFVAHNTIENTLNLDLSIEAKDSFLFIGSLNKRKGLDVLIDSFSEYLQKHEPTNIKKLVIIGDGELESELVNRVRDLNITKSVLFAGNVQDQTEKIEYFKNAVASISPFQAGLSVLESFSFGLPFITYENAISGGEHLNIIDDENGYLINSKEELIESMRNLDGNPHLAKKLGHNAFNYYHSKRKMQDMVNVFDDAFKFVIKNKP